MMIHEEALHQVYVPLPLLPVSQFCSEYLLCNIRPLILSYLNICNGSLVPHNMDCDNCDLLNSFNLLSGINLL